MLRLRSMQFWLATLWVGLLVGLWTGLRDHEYVAMLIGVPINLLLQYALFISIRKEKQKLLIGNNG